MAQLGPLTLDDFQSRKEKAEKDKNNAESNKKQRNKKKEKKEKQLGKWKSGDSPRYRWFCERSAEIEAAEEEEEWEDCSSIDSEEEEMEVDASIDVDHSVKCELDGVNQRIIQLNECMFDGKILPSLEANISYMEQAHSFFIPSKEYLTDLEGLMTYLHRKVGVGNICLFCNEGGKAFYSLAAVRDHMTKQGHCRLEMTGEKAFEYADFYDFDESDDEVEEIDDGNTAEMVLANGGVIGHRSMWKYFKQSFDPRMALVPSKRANQINKYRAIGWIDTKDQVKQLREFKRVAKWTKKNQLRVNLRNNMNDNMKHFVRRDGFCQ